MPFIGNTSAQNGGSCSFLAGLSADLHDCFFSLNSHAPGTFQAAKKVYGSNVLNFRVPDTLEFPRSYGKRQPLTYRLPEHSASKVYSDFAKWVIKNVK